VIANRTSINTLNTPVGWAKHRQAAILLFLILVLGAFLRFYDLGAESIWLDEAFSIKESFLSIPDMANSSNQPPLFFLLLRGWISLFGTGEIAIRSLSAVFGLISVFLVFLVGKSLFNQRTGLIAAFLSSIAYYPVQLSQDARAYSLLLLVSLLSYWFFIQILKNDRLRLYPLYFLSTLFLVYTHFYGLFILASQVILFAIFFSRYRPQRWKFISVLGLTALSLLPFALLLKDRISSIASDGFWLSKPGFGDIISTLTAFSGVGPARYLLLAIFISLALLGIVTLARVNKFKMPNRPRKYQQENSWRIQVDHPERYSLLLLWLFVPILIPFIESQFMTPIFQSKYAIGAYPALCLLAAGGLNNLKWQWIFYPVLSLIVILSSIGLQQYYRYDTKEQWREVAQLITSEAQLGDILFISEKYYQEPFAYYYKGEIEQIGFNDLDEAKILLDSTLLNTGQKPERIWLILTYGKDQAAGYFIKTLGKDALQYYKKYHAITVYHFDLR